jgi:cytochrome d ubiquinol oxidase subunit II
MRLTLTTANVVPLDDFGPPSVSLWAGASPATRRLFALIGAQFILPVILRYSFWSDYVLRGTGRMGDGFL